jgi:putative nucleotidyltransferase with HDIG domain
LRDVLERDVPQAEELIKLLVAAIRASALYSPKHPFVTRSVEALIAAFDDQFRRESSLSMAFLEQVIVVGRERVRVSPTVAGLARQFAEGRVEKVTFSRDMGREGLRAFVDVVAARDGRPLGERLAASRIPGVGVGTLPVDDEASDPPAGMTAARALYGTVVGAANAVWQAAQAGAPDPHAAREIIETLAESVSTDPTSMMALTAIKHHDAYTFTHMVNVSILAMAQARTLGIDGPLLREFGLSALMHDIGKVKTPIEILNKPDRLTPEETAIMRRHVVDGAQMLRRTPEMPALAPVVAFEHHLKQDLSGYPENTGSRTLNLCTMLVSIADVFDALRSRRVYRDGLPSVRARAMLAEQSGTAFEPTLLRRFISLIGIFPIGTLVRLKGGEIAVVQGEHAADPFRPQVRIVIDAKGYRLSQPLAVDTADRTDRGQHPHTVLEAVDPEEFHLDPSRFDVVLVAL